MVGLTLPLSGIFLAESTQGGIAMAYSFGSLALGAGIFYLGWLLQQRTEG